MRLLDALKEFLSREHVLAADRSGQAADIETQAATALLLLEAAHGDEEYIWREHRAIVRGLRRAFGLGRAEVLELLDRSEQIRPPRVRLEDVTRVILERYDEAQRLEVLRLLWQVIEADEFTAPWESAFASHVARAVGVSEQAVAAVRRETRAP